MIFFSFAALFADDLTAGKITISKVKVFLDEEEITEESEKTQNDGKIRYSTIMSYTKFRENKKFSEKQIQKEAETTRLWKKEPRKCWINIRTKDGAASADLNGGQNDFRSNFLRTFDRNLLHYELCACSDSFFERQ